MIPSIEGLRAQPSAFLQFSQRTLLKNSIEQFSLIKLKVIEGEPAWQAHEKYIGCKKDQGIQGESPSLPIFFMHLLHRLIEGHMQTFRYLT